MSFFEYARDMSKPMEKSSTVTVRNKKTGEVLTVRGAGALKDRALPLRKGIDLTKPISGQILREKKT